jgi:sortase (surface protein transpeptidase)
VIALVALVAAVLIATAGGDGGGLRFLGIGSAAEGSDGSPTSAREIDQFLGDDGEPVVQQDSVDAFAALHGDPPNTDYARLRIPAIGVNAPVGRWIVDSSIMPDPYGPVDVAFYDLSDWSGLGGFPGEGHNAVFGGHVDLNRDVAYAGAHYRGPAVFWGLDQLSAGTVIELDYAGETLRYAVVWSEDVSAATGTDWRQYWTSNVAVDSITLFTCGGEFDFESRSYSHRTVVRAERI